MKVALHLLHTPFVLSGRATVAISVVVFFLTISLFAGDREDVTVKTSSLSNKIVLVNAEVNGKHVQLECFLSVAHCTIPKEGEYSLVRLPAGKGAYMDCPNVHLYKKSVPQSQGARIGEYCLLGE